MREVRILHNNNNNNRTKNDANLLLKYTVINQSKFKIVNTEQISNAKNICITYKAIHGIGTV